MNGLQCFKVVNRLSCPSLILKTLLRCQSIRYSSQISPMNVFDRKAKRLQKDRAAMLDDHTVFDYIKEEVGWRTADRMSYIKTKNSSKNDDIANLDNICNFDNVLDLGCGKGFVGRNLLRESIGNLHQTEISNKLLRKNVQSIDVPTTSIVIDEEYLPFRSNLFDLVVSSLSLHWVNNLPSTLNQVFNILVNNGCFIGTMFGGDTLHELRVSLYLAELERMGGYSPHISPFTSARDLGGLLQRSGFVMLTLDAEDITINYPSIMELMYDLKGMGENNCAWNRCLSLSRDTLLAAGAIYQEKFGSLNCKDDAGNDVGASIPATFEVINFIAWKPDKSQLQPAKRGSGQVSMKDIGNLDALEKQIDELKKDKSLDPRKSKQVEELQKMADKLIKDTKDDKKDN